MRLLIPGLFVLIFLLFGCISQPSQDNNVSEIIDDVQETIQPELPLETLPEEEPDKEIETQKLKENFVCNDPLIFEKIDELFEGELFIGQLAGLGGGRGIFTCNILIDNQAIIQMEIRSQFGIESATYFFNDQERQYFLQVSDFEKTQETITETSYSYYSPSTGETRILFMDTDREKPAVVKIKVLLNYDFGPEKLFEVANALEKII